ncbi:hypothetical protein TRFO_32902 [Tritrichomonas foetus]|uniref:Uncharacterized protein n=1 Tax=Tritrichomonas foetus TaxID=1144522 RepID=A0A1J4JMZ2_9EUKA|nr:hypothetical protein TRFO_32902 [Tritrichomonas foetus]|eukprot:OHT00443.1 hypothetical protein TRFO_32902 [Tritrichomonas foetus]
MRAKKRFYCFIDKLVCKQAAVFNPSLIVIIGPNEIRLINSSSEYPTFYFKQKIKCSIHDADECGMKANSVTFSITENSNENSNEVCHKKMGFSLLTGNQFSQKTEIKSENGDIFELFFRGSICFNEEIPSWFVSINAPFAKSINKSSKSMSSSFLDDSDDSQTSSSEEPEEVNLGFSDRSFYGNRSNNQHITNPDHFKTSSSAVPSNNMKVPVPTPPSLYGSGIMTNGHESKKSVNVPKFPAFNPQQRIQLMSGKGRTLPVSSHRAQSNAGTEKKEDTHSDFDFKFKRPKTKSFSSNIPPFASTLNPSKNGEADEDNNEEEDECQDEMPSKDDSHVLTGLEIFIQAKWELLLRHSQETAGYEIGKEFMKLSNDIFTLEQKYGIILLESFLIKIGNSKVAYRCYNSLLQTYQMVLTNIRLAVHIRKIIRKLIQRIYKNTCSKVFIAQITAALTAGPSSKEFSTAITKFNEMRSRYPGDSGKFLFDCLLELADCEMCNLMITKMIFNSYSMIQNLNSNLPAFETIGSLKFSRLGQSFKVISSRNELMACPLLAKRIAPLLSSTFIFYLLSIVRPDKAFPQALPFEKLQKFALISGVNSRKPLEECLLKPGRLLIPKHIENLEPE